MRIIFFLLPVLLFSCSVKYHGRKCPEIIKGYASFYGKKFHKKKTTSGEIYSMYRYTAAHRYLPFGTVLLVKNLKNGRSVKVTVNDRGPFVRGRVLDLSYIAAKKIGMLRDGIVPIIAKVLRCGR